MTASPGNVQKTCEKLGFLQNMGGNLNILAKTLRCGNRKIF